MQGSNTRTEWDDEAGTTIVAALLMFVVMAALAGGVMITSVSNSKATSRHVLESKLLFAAESGLNQTSMLLAANPLYAVNDIGGYTVDATVRGYVSGVQKVALETGKSADFVVTVRYTNAGAPVLFADRSNPTEAWDLVSVSCRASTAGAVREITGQYRMEFGSAAAILSVAQPSGPANGGKGGAKNGNLVFDGKGRSPQHYLYGGVLANGDAHYTGHATLPAATVTTDNAGDYLGGYRGQVDTNLAGTADEVPDFTAIGGGQQLFDFDRFYAAAQAGAGQVFSGLDDFKAAVVAGTPLEGIIVIDIDSASESSPKLRESDLGGPIDVTGTLMFHFSDGTDRYYKVVIEVDVNVNAADLSGVDPADESTFATAYPPVYTLPGRDPASVDITPAFKNFTAGDDLPAIMFNTAVVDFHRGCNVCGAIYGPSFIEIENKVGRVQYINGAVIGGDGIYFQGNSSAGYTAVRHDTNSIRRLATNNGVGQELIRVGYAITR